MLLAYFCQVRFLWRWARSFLRRLCLLIFALRRFFSEPIGVWDWDDEVWDWSDGVLEYWVGTVRPQNSITPLLQNSISPSLHHPVSYSVGQYTTLLSGYSMIPSAPAALSCGM